MLLGINLLIIFMFFGLLALLIVPIVLSRIRRITAQGVLIFSFVSGVVSASGYAEDRLRDKLYHVQSEMDWDFVVEKTWESFPTALFSYCVGYTIFLFLCFYISKMFKK